MEFISDASSEEEKEIPADRGIPSVAVQPKTQIILMAVFLALALAAIVFVIIDDRNKNVAGTALVEPEELAFRSPSGSALPYIEPGPELPERMPLEPPAPPAPARPDPATMQKEQALQQEAMRIAREQQQRLEQRIQSPQLVYDQQRSQNAADAQYYAGISPAAGGLPGTGTGNPDLAFANDYTSRNIETAHATQLQNLHALVPQGTMIAGILETAIQSDLPGMVRAVVSEDVYGFDGTALLIPKGSRLIGAYRSGLVRGQSRVFVIWNRLIRVDGVSINIGSFGADDLGRSGLSGSVDTHFFERFGSSVLLSLIDSGLKMGVESLDNDYTATIALQTGDDFSRASEIALENSVAIPPTIHIDQGTRIKVFVSKDLDFSNVTESMR